MASRDYDGSAADYAANAGLSLSERLGVDDRRETPDPWALEDFFGIACPGAGLR